ncbi:MAG: hypothetical protein KGV50_01710 [Gammaproteobacteria bacterium]|nr:hypothetical protein [Gammaproteobacteria bacterium]
MKKYLLLAMATAALSGCVAPDIFNEQNSSKSKVSSSKDTNMITETHRAADKLTTQASYLQNELKPILITSVANISDLDSSSAFGLMISEQIGSRISQFGFPVVDLRTRKDIKIRENSGEFMLSRDLRKLSRQHAAGAVLVGTYAKGSNNVYVSVRLVRPDDNRVLASYDFGLPMGPDTRKMLKTKSK